MPVLVDNQEQKEFPIEEAPLVPVSAAEVRRAVGAANSQSAAEPFRAQIEALVAQGFGTAEISEALNIDAAVVRQVAGTTTQDDAADMLIVLKGIAGDRRVNPGVRAKAAIYVHEEAHGRNSKKVEVAAGMVGILDLAAHLGSLRMKSLPSKARREVVVAPTTNAAPEAPERPSAREAGEAPVN